MNHFLCVTEQIWNTTANVKSIQSRKTCKITLLQIYLLKKKYILSLHQYQTNFRPLPEFLYLEMAKGVEQLLSSCWKVFCFILIFFVFKKEKKKEVNDY